MAAKDTGSGHPDLEATDARSGRPGVPVFWVLAISTVAALIVMAIVWAMFSQGLGGSGGQRQITTPAQAQKFDTPVVPASRSPALNQ